MSNADDFRETLDRDFSFGEEAVAKESFTNEAPQGSAHRTSAGHGDARQGSATLRRAGKGGARQSTGLFFDLETCPDESRMHLFGLDPVAEYVETPGADLPHPQGMLEGSIDAIKSQLKPLTPPDAWLDELVVIESATPKPRKGVLDLVAEKRGAKQASLVAKAERVKLLSVTPEFCRIVAFGWAVGNDEPKSAVVGEPATATGTGVTDERDLLEIFWQLAARYSPLIGFNILHFDLKVIATRCAILDVQPTKLIDRKPWGHDVLDIYHTMFDGRGPSGGRPGKLKVLAPLYGIEVPAGDVDGSNVYDLMQAGEFAKVGQYVRSDVAVCRSLYKKLEHNLW